MKKTISIVTPVYNEEQNIDYYFQEMNKVLSSLEDRYNFEFVFTDNRSTDNTFARLKQKAKTDSRIRVYRFSRNFGYQRSIFTGYSLARGDAAIEFDCDLQDSPELLPKFLEFWEKGYQVIYGVRKKRAEGFFVTFLRKVFYRFLARISEHEIPVDAGDFMMMDRKAINALKEIYDPHIYIRGLVFSLGFNQYGFEYERNQRLHGTSKFPLKKMFLLAIDGVISQSTVPLRIASVVGFFISVGTFLGIIFYTLLKVFSDGEVKGFTTTVTLILLSIGLNSIFLGIIGEYLARIYKQTKRQPLTVIDEFVDNENTKF